MIFLIYGEEKFLIDKFINDEIERNNILEVCKFDYSKDGIKPALEECSYVDLFSSTKAIILNNSTFLCGKGEVEDLDKYIDNPNESSYLFITVNEKKLDERKSIVKKLISKVHVRVYNKMKETEANKFIKDYLKNENIEIKAPLIDMIIKRVGINLYSLSNELDKLIMYKLGEEDRTISENDIEKVISVSLEGDIFKLTNALNSGNVKTILNIYNDLIRLGNHPSMILTLVANQYRLLYQAKVLSRSAYTESDITHELGIHPYQAKLALQNSLNYSEGQLLGYLKKLAIIDEEIKTSSVDINTILENFFISISK